MTSGIKTLAVRTKLGEGWMSMEWTIEWDDVVTDYHYDEACTLVNVWQPGFVLKTRVKWVNSW